MADTQQPQKSASADRHGSDMDQWQQHLAESPQFLDLPVDRARQTAASDDSASYRTDLDESIRETLQDFCDEHGVSPDEVLLACLVVVLSRHCNQDGFRIGVVTNPDAVAADSVVASSSGGSHRVLPVRCSLTPDRGFLDLLHALRDDVAAAGTFATWPLTIDAIAETHLQVAFAHGAFAEMPSLCSGLDLMMVAAEDFSAVTLHYKAALFDADTMVRLANHVRQILVAALAAPSMDSLRLPMLGSAERRQLLQDWNTTAAAYQRECVHHLFEQQVARTPHAPALVFGERKLSYEELNERANRLAHYLVAQGVGPEVLVGVCVTRSLEMIVAMLGILKAGGAYLPLDPAYPQQRLDFMVEDARPALILTLQELRERIAGATCRILCVDSEWTIVEGCAAQNPAVAMTPDNLAYVIYTSGSTGRPKGVLLQHGGLANLCEAQGQAFEVDASSQVLQFASISFDASVSETFVTLTRGACLHLVRPECLRSAFEILKLIEQSRISVVTLPPSLLAVLPVKELPALRTLVLAGEAWPPELARKWAGGRRMLNAYGPTEGTVCATWGVVAPDVGTPVPIGKAMANVQVYILDAHMQPVPVGVAGEIYIGGVGIARGYLNRPDLTAQRFVADPFAADPDARLYRTGDKARYRADGNIEFLGRFDDQVKLRGYRIELGEIEAALVAVPGVQTAVVVVREDHPGEKRLTAYVVATTQLTTQDLRTHLKGRLPDYMVPQSFLAVEEFPMSPNGKVDRKALPHPDICGRFV